ncbi:MULTISPECIES: sodium:proton antiporter [Actinopolyspora]|uniref:Multicomponent Na+:H+ antiporter subunit C n=1 Tax=Actinopolyspora saharensis TaxID=995062 RepID=A0A1H0YWE6_9ACTN|nr:MULTISPECIES: NADH-quinone oxidoreductase subunit K [Actinopolyspora]NHD19364.1 cation:proton antiporter [Actinopolyspora sp. BKK2]NHE78563.1 cation:proton antiporter [Actinopolyspora sp. BKK1]SDQ19483.1 multicomponent Na+:H+ antiporter subunit C [Actinopolyspora saharensis]
MSAAIATGVLAAAGIYLLLHGSLVRVVIGFLLLQHAVNLLLVTARSPQRDEAPILPAVAPQDPLGQAFVVTAIVIGFASVIFLLALTLRYVRAVRASGSAGRGNSAVESASGEGGGGASW